MKICTWESADAPEHLRWAAMIVDGKNLMPIRFTGRTQEGVRAACQKWWVDNHKPPAPRKTKGAAEPIEDMDVI